MTIRWRKSTEERWLAYGGRDLVGYLERQPTGGWLRFRSGWAKYSDRVPQSKKPEAFEAAKAAFERWAA